MGSTLINHPTKTEDYEFWLKHYDQAFTLELDEKAMITVTCEKIDEWNKMFKTNFDEKKADKMVQALGLLLEREGKQFEEIYKEIEDSEDY